MKETEGSERVSLRLSFRDAFGVAAKQTELACFSRTERDFARELCYIIAETYMMPFETGIRIGEETMPAEMVQEVFGELRAEHLHMVMEKYGGKTEIVRNKRAYLRTALYNAVFEFEAEYINRVAHDTKGAAT